MPVPFMRRHEGRPWRCVRQAGRSEERGGEGGRDHQEDGRDEEERDDELDLRCGARRAVADAARALSSRLGRERYVGAAALLGAAVLLKQFALVALPFLAAAAIVARVPRATLARAAAVFAGIVAAGALPFLVADPRALWDDTVAYGAGTYRIVGYGLASILVRAGAIEDRFDPYPFLPIVALVWLPLTAWLVRAQLRSPALWTGAAGFAISIFVLIFLGRVFQTSYLVWPLTGIALAALLAAARPDDERAPE